MPRRKIVIFKLFEKSFKKFVVKKPELKIGIEKALIKL